MNKQGILTGTVKTGLNLIGMIPVGVLHDLTPKGGTVDRYITENKNRIREVVGAGILAGIGISTLN